MSVTSKNYRWVALFLKEVWKTSALKSCHKLDLGLRPLFHKLQHRIGSWLHGLARVWHAIMFVIIAVIVAPLNCHDVGRDQKYGVGDDQYRRWHLRRRPPRTANRRGKSIM